MRIVTKDKLIDIPYESTPICIKSEAIAYATCDSIEVHINAAVCNGFVSIARFENLKDAKNEMRNIRLAYSLGQKVYELGVGR